MGISLVNPLQDPYWAETFFDIPSIKVAVNKKVFNIWFKMENIFKLDQIALRMDLKASPVICTPIFWGTQFLFSIKS